MKITPTRVLLAWASAMTLAHAQAAESEPIIPAMSNPALKAQAGSPNEDPLKPIMGRWTTNTAKFTSATSEQDLLNYNTTWTGRMFGLVKTTGVIVFKSDNGCILTGLATPFTANSQWTINGRLEGCTPSHYNQKVFGNLRRNDSLLVMDLSEIPFSVGKPPVTYRITAVMRSY